MPSSAVRGAVVALVVCSACAGHSSAASPRRVSVLSELVFSPDGETGTLAGSLANVLDLATKRFGPMQTAFPFAGIEFAASPTAPQVKVWRSNTLILQLDEACLRDKNRALSQLAHQAVHVVLHGPTVGHRTQLEEGLAVTFGEDYLSALGIAPVAPPRAPSAEERTAAAGARELWERCPSAVYDLRQARGHLDGVVAADLLGVCPELPPDVAAALAGDATPE